MNANVFYCDAIIDRIDISPLDLIKNKPAATVTPSPLSHKG